MKIIALVLMVAFLGFGAFCVVAIAAALGFAKFIGFVAVMWLLSWLWTWAFEKAWENPK